MTQVIVDEALRTRLNGLEQQVELLDESGRTLGQFLPAEEFQKLLRVCGVALFTDEEVAAAEMQPREGATLAEIWNRLGRS